MSVFLFQDHFHTQATN